MNKGEGRGSGRTSEGQMKKRTLLQYYINNDYMFWIECRHYTTGELPRNGRFVIGTHNFRNKGVFKVSIALRRASHCYRQGSAYQASLTGKALCSLNHT